MARIADPTLRATILKAAREIFRQKGFTDARISDLAALAGIAVGTFYLYFKTKQSLVVALGDALNQRIINESIPLLREGDFRLALERSARKTIEICYDEHDLLVMVHLQMGLAAFTEPNHVDDELVTRLSEALAERVEAGEVRRYEPKLLAMIVGSLVDRIVLLGFLLPEAEAKAIEDEMIRFLQHALIPDESKQIILHTGET